jgi:hypothetical protein
VYTCVPSFGRMQWVEWVATAYTMSLLAVVATAQDHLAVTGDDCGCFGAYILICILERPSVYTCVPSFGQLQWVELATFCCLLQQQQTTNPLTVASVDPTADQLSYTHLEST